MNPRVSALIVNYRSYDETSRCLASLGPASPEIERIVVDHATDPGALAGLRRAHPQVLFTAGNENPGFGAGINRAARLARGRLLLVLNPDTIVGPDVVDTLRAWIDTRHDTALVGPLVHAADGSIEASARAFPGWSTVFGGRRSWLSRRWPSNPLSRRNLLTGSDVVNPIDVDWVSGVCMLIRREAFEAVGGFDERFFLYWEDADLCRRLKQAGWRIAYHPGCHVVHLGGRSSRHRAVPATLAFHRSVYRYFIKHGGSWRYALAPLVFVALQARLGVSVARAALGGSRGR